MLDNKKIETLSVNAVRDSIDMCEHISQYISDNDKEPTWDGNIYVYSESENNKENIHGRVPVQVKGTQNDDFSKEEISFSISTIDLKNYLKDGGVVFFVVYLGNMGLIRQIYYSVLTPIKLRIIIESAKNQKTKCICLKKFPNSPQEKENIIINALNNFNKQHSFSDTNLFTLEELQNNGVLESIEIPILSVKGTDPKKALFDNEVYIYAKIKGSSVSQPIEAIIKEITSHEERNVEISVQGRIFYNKITIEDNGKQVKYIIGNSFTVFNDSSKKRININYKNSPMVRILAKDLDFVISFIEHRNIEINGIKVFNEENWDIDFKSFNIDEQKTILNQAKKTVLLLDELGCKEDLNISKLDERSKRYLDYLIRGIVDNESINNLKKNLNPVSIVRVGKLSFWVYLQEIESGKYNLFDFFTSKLAFSYETDSGERVECSRYLLPKSEDYETIDNIHFENILPSLQKVERNPETMIKANAVLMHLLNAYDRSKKSIIINTAFDLSKWLYETDDENLPYAYRVINYLQVKKRLGKLDESDIKLLEELIIDFSEQNDVLVGAYLLLEQQIAAEIYFKKLNDNQQEEFKSFPIYYFWNSN